MKNLVAIVLVGEAALSPLLAVDPSLLMRTQADPSRMEGRRTRIMNGETVFLKGGETAYTHMTWVRMPRRGESTINMFSSFWSVDPARATREGGDELEPLVEYQTVNDNWGTTFADPHYSCPETLVEKWGYGCYCVNIETPVDVTVTVAGAERFVAASNGVKQVFNIQGVAADYSVSVTGAAGGNAQVRFGMALNQLVEFHGMISQPMMAGTWEMAVEGGNIKVNMSNEWNMVVSRVRIENGSAVESLAKFTWDQETIAEGETTNAVGREVFARDARAAIRWHTMGLNTETDVVEMYGHKIFQRWLSDDELRNVRDLDVFEMRRRGMQRWRFD